VRSLRLTFAAVLLLSMLACSLGGGEEEATPTRTTVPTRTPRPEQPTRMPTEEQDAPPGDGLDFRLEPNFGEVELESGFLPDPFTVAVVSGGPVYVIDYDLGDECWGYATSSPDFRLYLTDSSPGLRFFFVADVLNDDATLIVNTPDNEWVCNDDYGSGVDPLVQLVPAGAGQYDIWVASFSEDEFVDGTLYITEMDITPDDYSDGASLPPAGGNGLDYSLEPNYGEVELASGFVPDPYSLEMIAGGPVDVYAYDLGDDCWGYATSSPDFRLYLTDASSGMRIFFVADGSDEDTTLIINTPTGAWVCNDDYDSGYDPMVELAPAAAGQYDIWVGSFSEDEYVGGTLYITEVALSPGDF